MSSVLVTGGAGYIGSHAVKALQANGTRAVVYDNLSAGHRAAARYASALVEGDIRDTPCLREAMREHHVDAVMHFAAWASVGDSVRDPSGYYNNNVLGALSVLDAMVAERIPHFVFSSTAAVFGNPVRTPIDETHPTAPINAYGETKLAIERALRHYETAYGIRSMALRYFNAAGADPDGELGEDHAPERHLIPRAIDAALGRDTFAIFGDDYDTPDGTCLRDYIHVTDLASAHVLALDALRAGAASARYNLGNGRPTSVKDVVGSVERVLGRKVRAAVAPRRQGDPAVLFASSARITHELGWTPAFEDIDVIVGTASRWRDAHPQGYGDRTAA
ncbi:MAG: UDP-glucose 4-epimerase GalE [Acidobacteria bacterium RIFCSPLOWO2_02_FULL_67_36]|nr:MAG: UDP-glucose 4-epimerase GalE [Acidobacteria bacterium RIFCSPLOWO2_02_FULL_67_36]OFW25080.1 MAG: UDP-glucose 4-epimerase GalE [Acidobacteria bacterium RIFCSPLOWO2_12_FULL_66_21]